VAGRSFSLIAKELRSLPRADKPLPELLRDAMRVALAVVPADGWAVLTLDPATLLVTGGVHEHSLAGDAMRRWYELEYGEDDVLKFASLSRELTPVALLADATRRDLTKSPRYRSVLAPAGYQHELRAALRSMKHTWGGLFLLRKSGAPDFVVEEESFVRELADALGDAIRATLRAAGAAADERMGRAILVLGHNHELLAQSASASVWLEELSGDGPKDASGLPHTVRSTVNGARRGAERGGQTSAHVRVRGKSGQWLIVHAAVLGDGKSVVTVEEGRPIAIASSLLSAYGLSPLEGEVLRDLLHGAEDAQIAEHLNVGVPAVQADVANVLRKVGVATRAELPKRLFFEHYFERVQVGTPLDPDGFFALT
jgi:DNA-binding CsgD family transcriptional regulator/GAF domain-containing protein